MNFFPNMPNGMIPNMPVNDNFMGDIINHINMLENRLKKIEQRIEKLENNNKNNYIDQNNSLYMI